MDAVKFVKERKRMCDSYLMCADGCPIKALKIKYDEGCGIVMNNHADEFVDAVEKWSADHPIKTRASDLLEKLPKASVTPQGYPISCAMVLGYCDTCIGFTDEKSCKECWETPLEEYE